jgi:hypothetical protein
MNSPSELLRFRVLPRSRADGHLVHAHLEAYDHLATATDLNDGSLEIVGPSARGDEIRAAVRDIATWLGALVVEGPTESR